MQGIFVTMTYGCSLIEVTASLDSITAPVSSSRGPCLAPSMLHKWCQRVSYQQLFRTVDVNRYSEQTRGGWVGVVDIVELVSQRQAAS